MIALLLAAFILYFYTPHLLFKSAAATQYDLITRKGLPQVEEFFTAGLPSLILNGITYGALWLAYSIRGAAPIIVDRAAAASAFQKEPDLSMYVAAANLRPLLCYVGALGVVSWLAGQLYGGILAKVARAGGSELYLTAPLAATWPWGRRNLLPDSLQAVFVVWRGFMLLYRRAWRLFYATYEHPLYPVVLRNSYAFVHTNHGLYHGVLFQFDKNQDGDTEAITLIGVSRFSRQSEAECLRQGKNPISDLSGPLSIKWSDVIDINYPPNPEVLERKRAYYAERLAQRKQRAGAKRRHRDFVRGLHRRR